MGRGAGGRVEPTAAHSLLTTAAARAPYRKRKCTRGHRWLSRWRPSMCCCPPVDGCFEGSWLARSRPAGLGFQLAGSGKVSPGSRLPPKAEEEGSGSCFLQPPCSPPSLSFARFWNAGDAGAPGCLKALSGPWCCYLHRSRMFSLVRAGKDGKKALLS